MTFRFVEQCLFRLEEEKQPQSPTPCRHLPLENDHTNSAYTLPEIVVHCLLRQTVPLLGISLCQKVLSQVAKICLVPHYPTFNFAHWSQFCLMEQPRVSLLMATLEIIEASYSSSPKHSSLNCPSYVMVFRSIPT